MIRWETYPYSNVHELNIDWILTQLRELDLRVDNYTELNTIKYADPIDWDITSQYEVNTIVVKQPSGNVYISKQPVPAGININNTNYWLEVGSFANILDYVKENIATDERDNSTSTHNYLINQLLWNSNNLYRTLRNINIGDAFVVDENITKCSVEEYIYFLNNLNREELNNLFSQLELEIQTQLQDYDTRIRNNSDNIELLQEQISSITQETLEYFKNKRVVIFGDSLSDEDTQWDVSLIPNWVVKFKDKLNGVASSITNNSLSSRTVSEQSDANLSILNAIENQSGSYDIVIIFGGVNDYLQGVSLGAGDSTSRTTFNGALNIIGETIKSKWNNADIFYITPLLTSAKDTNTKWYQPIQMFRKCISNACYKYGWNLINGTNFALLNPRTRTQFMGDGLHVKSTASSYLCDCIMKSIALDTSEELKLISTYTPIPSECKYSAITYNNAYMYYDGDSKVKLIVDTSNVSQYQILQNLDMNIFRNFPPINNMVLVATSNNKRTGECVISSNTVSVYTEESNTRSVSINLEILPSALFNGYYDGDL